MSTLGRGLLLLLPFLFGPLHTLGAQSPQQPIVTGQVTNVEGRPVVGVVVRVEGTRLQALTDGAGIYRLERVPAGPRVLTTEHLGYAPARVSLTVPATGEVTRDIRIAARALEIEGITVTADPVSRARGEATTATVIAEPAIRQQTASSLAGVLELLPGVAMAPPGLASVQQITLRAVPTSGTGGSTGSGDLASFGTLIIVDGVPLSNNANLQSLGPRGEISFSSSAGGGIDLRQIPAATLERVEVIRGVPSARYGDLTQGAIVVDTRAGVVEPEIRTQYDPHTVEATGLGGWEVGAGQTATMNFDYARTRILPGVTDDYAHRFAGQLAHRYEMDAEGGATVLDTRLDLYSLEEDLPTNENTRPGYSTWARETGLRLSERARRTLADGTELSLTGSLTWLRQRSRTTSGMVRGAMPFTDRLTPGRAEGWFVSGLYEAEARLEGDPRLVYVRAEADRELRWLGGRHRLRGGVEVRREWNSGAGYQFDMEYPPQVAFNGVQGYDRPRTFASIPALATSSAYLDDRITGSVGRDVAYTLQLGLRVDGLHDQGAWLPKLRDGALQPRLWGELAPRPWLRFRGGWGLTAKTPSIGNLSPAPQYNDVINVNWYANQPEERLAVLTTFVFDPTNADLGFSTASKAEAGVEVEGGGSVVAVVAFRDRIRGGVGTLQEPTFLLREHFQITDSVNGNGIPPELIEPATGADTVPILIQRPTNFIELENRGIELTVTSAEVPRIRTRIQVQGSWLRTRRSFSEPYFGSAQRFSDFQLLPTRRRAPWWDGVEEVAVKHLLTYRLIHHQPDLGLVITASIQHNVRDFREDVGARDTLAFAGYVTRTGELVEVSQGERGRPEYQDLRVARGGLIVPESTHADWMMALQVGKTLPLSGELRFWGFNVLDRVGRYQEGGRQPRVYPRVRFGVELRMVPRVLLGDWS